MTFLKKIRCGSLVFWLLFPFAASWAQQDHTARLIEGAKKEGKLLWYTALTLADAGMLTQQFEQKYPFIKTETLRLGTDQLLTKIQTEARAGAIRADVIEIPGILGQVLKQDGLLEKYVSPESKAYPASMKDPDGTWTSFFINTHVTVYNTRLVQKQEVPKTFEDFINPRWKGKVAVRDNDFDNFGMMLKVMGREKGTQFYASIGGPGRRSPQQLHDRRAGNRRWRDPDRDESLRNTH